MSPTLPKELQALVENLRDFDPKKLTDEVIKAGELWADEDATASTLEETKKTLLASYTLDYMHGTQKSGALGEKPKAVSVAEAEKKALSDERYDAHLKSMVHARREANRARVRYDMGKMRIELMRSLQATLRNEMRLSGNT